jgi:hypothetical protein
MMVRMTASLQPRDHRYIDAVALGDGGQRLAGRTSLDRFGALVVAQFALAAELDAFDHGSRPACPGSLPDQLALEFGDGGQHGHQEPPLSTGGVEKRVAERAERRAGLSDAPVSQVDTQAITR